ncbi:class I SAM-dependent methyltransferase [Pseudorhodoplanes sinuspersici]|uniref:Methyltransferase n=1 Tax=Pseudorhodoplanes sinuspersici TaxID=1235591 RepID=A0A1W6ZNM4_9HYPH|nr:class I SAM-dependent methyltransferase [Pseudorhodoplanes sinuspersici]ARP98827.1 methyltransferase [Pseudorhodoplanes sinuspersici]RKE69556.1 tRNA (cmo5U34)-methyltransferase [Pseudorhodoplanes sinuspersici]
MSVSELLAPFRDSEAVARYTEGPRRFVPGVADMHTMTGLLLAERAPTDARVLVLGAGGGLELKALADMHAGWTFDGVDPAPEMLALAQRTVGVHAMRVRLHEGIIDIAPDGPFDAATCLLTLHFLGFEERLRTTREIRRRLKPGAPFVAAHSSFPQGKDERAIWLSRYAAFAVASGVDRDSAKAMLTKVEAHLDMLSPEQDEAILREAGFTDVSLFYAAFTWRGWVAYA